MSALWEKMSFRERALAAIAAVTRDGSVTLAAQRIARNQPDLSRMLSDFAKRFAAAGQQPIPWLETLLQLRDLTAGARQLHRQIGGKIPVARLLRTLQMDRGIGVFRCDAGKRRLQQAGEVFAAIKSHG